MPLIPRNIYPEKRPEQEHKKTMSGSEPGFKSVGVLWFLLPVEFRDISPGRWMRVLKGKRDADRRDDRPGQEPGTWYGRIFTIPVIFPGWGLSPQ